jgi:hypothetical protein
LNLPGSVVQFPPELRNHWSVSIVQLRLVSGRRPVSRLVREGMQSATMT